MDAKRKEDRDSPKILLINLHSSCNAGDDALTVEALRQLREQFPRAQFTLSMNDPDSYRGAERTLGSFTAWVKPIYENKPSRWRWERLPGLILESALALVGYRFLNRPWFAFASPEHKALLEAYLEADMVISCAGNFLYSSGLVGLPFLLALFSMMYAWLAHRPLYTLPQTLGPLRRRWEHALAKAVLSKMRLVLVRDPISLAMCRRWNLGSNSCALFPDLAFSFSAFDPAERTREAAALLEAHGVECHRTEPLLGLTLVHWGAQSRGFSRQALYEQTVAAAIRSFLGSYGGQAVLFAQVHGPTPAEDDRVPARRVQAQLADLGNRVVLVEKIVPPQVLKAAYGHLDLLLGTRLHSNIFALTEGVPVVAIAYQYKTRGIMQMLGLQRWVLDIEDLHPRALTRLLNEAWKNRASTRAQIRDILPGMKERASQVGALIASDFSSVIGA